MGPHSGAAASVQPGCSAAAANPAINAAAAAPLLRVPPPGQTCQVLRLQRKLGELHTGDFNALRRAYTSLCQHVVALEEEAKGMVADMQVRRL